jgi:hypothetical protein
MGYDSRNPYPGAPMLDVHPPHAPTHTWKDFFIHIATITVGLLIAVGLEQTVELFHHRHQLNEIRAQLAEERETDRRILDYDKVEDEQMQAELATDIALLQRRAAGDKAPLSNKLRYAWIGIALRDGAWQSAKQGTVTSLMSEDELVIYSYRYFDFASYMQSNLELFPTMQEAAAIVHDTPGGDFTPDDVRDLIRLTHHAQGQLSLTQKYLGLCIKYGLSTKPHSDKNLDQPVLRLDQIPQ